MMADESMFDNIATFTVDIHAAVMNMLAIPTCNGKLFCSL